MTQSDPDTTRENRWHAMPIDAVFGAVSSDEGGLSSAEADRRRSEYGTNDIREAERASPLDLFVSQFQNPLIYLLFAAAILSLGVGVMPGSEPNYAEAAFIGLIIGINGLFGFVQDYQATRSIEALRELASPDATVLRDGRKRSIDAERLVPGDIVYLEQGDAIPADARVLDADELRTNESPLTGESTPVAKSSDPVGSDVLLAERSDMVYKNTTVVKGRGSAIVVETGMQTEVGGIAARLGVTADRRTPFQTEVEHLGKQIGGLVVSLIVLVVAVQFLFTATEPVAIILVGITLAVAGVPEGLPAVVTFTLALGAREMVDRNALVRRLPVVESLGSIDVIVTDKTGTVTENRMTVTRLYASGAVVDPSDFGSQSADLDVEGRRIATNGDRYSTPAIADVLRCGALCNNADRIDADEYRGDPTEIAIRRAADEADIEPAAERIREIPFSSERKRMTVVVEDGGPTAYTKGAPEVVLDRCDAILEDGDVRELTDETRAEILDRTRSFAEDALRVLAFASKTVSNPSADEDEIEDGMVFLGLQGMIDPPREGVEAAITDCRSAGIRTVLATGDNLTTAAAVGEQIGLDPDGALEGSDVADRSDAELERAVEDIDVFARVTPDHKVSLLNALQSNGHNVVMTGDGVNDAPALTQADVGVAMGQRGTDVARQASDMILQDDNFATIRDAIQEGRGIFENVRKFVNYLVSTNTGEVLVVFLGVLLGSALFSEQFSGTSQALILTPVLILWINLIADTLPALAIGADPHAAGLMDRPPRPADEGVINTRVLASILTIAVLLALTGLGIFFYALDRTGSLVRAQSLLFTFIVVGELIRIQVIRSRYDQTLRSNPWLVGAIVLSFLIHLTVLYTPLHDFFRVVPLTPVDWGWIAVGFLVFLVLNVLVSELNTRIFESRKSD
ncbi:cation-translocating P-type ATPase [Halopiger xanaduensis]|uniref:ATPase, P-type (Transporting), HAD superfamily, subfamily IC n=1 Tax=Halopiger xanaduensis (strain DSM 18323 / JCM 14033 / SH-6) TaxID=797210 RepID=F8DEA6_HALXS|nr:cation-transporting P-type ATPase [Halopiger xanaduensis]AEH39388.1 ATPase, P-type (transporting), HAD superfamily, subfamily IC [Halopiger xanaduensis SH-6]